MQPRLTVRDHADQEVLTILNHAFSLYMDGDPVGARLAADMAASAVPVSGPAQAVLGRHLMSIDNPEAAEAALRTACDLGEADEDTLNQLALSLEAQGNFDEAIRRLEQVIALNPARADAYLRMGVILGLRRRGIAAITLLRQAVHMDPRSGELRLLLARTARSVGNAAVAAQAVRAAYALAPGHPAAVAALAEHLADRGDPRAALRTMIRASRLAPSDPALLSRCLDLRHGLPGQTPAMLASVHRVWQCRFGAPVPPRPLPADPTGRPLRVGLISPAFRDGPIGWIVRPLLAHRDPARIRVTLLSDGAGDDPVAEALRQRADAWIDVAGLSDDRVARIVRDAGLDVLIDMTGHGRGNRLTLFARQRPAPVQAAWAGYPGTTGLRAMDLVLTDAAVMPEDDDAHATERVVRLRHGILTLDPADLPETALQERASARPRTGGVALGGFAGPDRIGEPTVVLWVKALTAMPAAHLLLKDRAWADPGAVAHLRACFKAHGIAPDRLVVEASDSRQDLRSALAKVDVLLDPYPVSCALTALEALALGVPVVTLPGAAARSRLAAAQLARAGQRDGIAADADGYVAAAQHALSRPRTPVKPNPAAWATGFTAALEEAVAAVAATARAEEDEDALA
ncbi:tetratricopeptide repeat protein [Roseospira navarrensis]|uniref:O-linked N-acetylglucosamine transferase family protein n=1 Tax=Roseospira navarrensis TaxID=140058 RepID=UPI0014793BAD